LSRRVSFFHLECDGSANNPRHGNFEHGFIVDAANSYRGLNDATKTNLIDGTWSAASDIEEAHHWGYGCKIEMVGHPL
jgi:hypothetical protein